MKNSSICKALEHENTGNEFKIATANKIDNGQRNSVTKSENREFENNNNNNTIFINPNSNTNSNHRNNNRNRSSQQSTNTNN